MTRRPTRAVTVSRKRWLAPLTLAVVVSAAAVVLAGATPVIAGTPEITYPSSACPAGPTGLQACITNAPEGSILHVAAETVDESPIIAKSLTLDAADGFTPTLDALNIDGPASSSKITIEGLGFSFRIDVDLLDGTDHKVTIREVTVEGQSSSFGAIQIDTAVPADVTIERSVLHSEGLERATIEWSSQLAAGEIASLTAVANRIDQHDDDDGSSGIEMTALGAGAFLADVMNNVIWDVGACNCGISAGIAVHPNDTVDMDVNVVGNTIENNTAQEGAGPGIGLRNDLTTGGTLALDAFDNVIAHQDGGAFDLGEDPLGLRTFRAGYNAFFANGPSELDGESLGTGNLTVNPRFVDRAAGDLRLKSTSALIGAGLTCSPGGVANPDAAGMHRLARAEVDIGAYEDLAPPVTGVIRLGTAAAETLDGSEGRDILCGYGARDFLYGHEDQDYLDGGGGPDYISGGDGPDRAFGRKGTDELCMQDGVEANDFLDGGLGTDRFRADRGDVRVSVEQRILCV